MPSHPPRRWADEYPNQGPPPLNDLHDALPTVWSINTTRILSNDLTNLSMACAMLTAIAQSAPSWPGKPTIRGLTIQVTAFLHRVYHPPPPRTHPAQAARDAVISGRLAAIKPHFLYTGIRRVGTKNVVGACCEYLSLQPYMVETQGTLRTIRAVACEIETGIRRAFCPNCRQFATNAVNQFFGLRIIDESSGLVYQSAQTAAAYAAAESQQQQQQQAIQHSAVQPNYVAQQMFQLPPPQQTVPTVVQYYHPNQASQALPVAGPSNSGRSASKKKPKSGKTVVQY
ncbi:hypothetical protein MVEN_01792900 [Mycena venus]|uniref:Uncharacterized protein n=1 Tax=Mycena venus TaxID=2733690 RepID=A0A8H7CN29_9AGAR|nr:hypothetical protein MVEN_01792900 [Mycena venus]